MKKTHRIIALALLASLLCGCAGRAAPAPAAVPAALTASGGFSSPSQVIFEGDLDEINAYFTQHNMSDGLPVIPPTQAKVEEFLRFTDLAPEVTVGVLPPANANVTVYHVAVNGVMAGCKPEWMPLLIACTRAMADESWSAPLSGSESWNGCALLSGPVARQLGFDSGQGEITEENNAVFGRFINLAMRNLCGFIPGKNRTSAFGYVMPWTILENERACVDVGWEPYHVQQGLALNDSAVTMASALTWGSNLAPSTADPDHIKDLIAYDITEKSRRAIGSGEISGERFVLITEAVARDLAVKYTKDSLESALVRAARRPLDLVAYSVYWTDEEAQKGSLRQTRQAFIDNGLAQQTDAPSWYKGVLSGKIYTVPALALHQAALLITGDSDRNKVQIMPGGPRVTVAVELPGNWDALMAELAYRPLSEFCL